ncbi:MAG: hypothetical protein Q4A93_03290 [Actinomycetota bacterium]|nr:hypothetical protein [Actinomycetota bacterium]
MNEFLASNEWQWRLLRTVVQGVLGVLVMPLVPVLRLAPVRGRVNEEGRLPGVTSGLLLFSLRGLA